MWRTEDPLIFQVTLKDVLFYFLCFPSLVFMIKRGENPLLFTTCFAHSWAKWALNTCALFSMSNV